MPIPRHDDDDDDDDDDVGIYFVLDCNHNFF